MKEKFFKDKKYAVLGLGVFGLETALFLQRQGASVVGWDDQIAARTHASAQGISVENILHIAHCDGIFPSPGIPLYGPLQHPCIAWALDHQIPILSDIDLLYSLCPKATYIGITGTNGKSTTTLLLTHLLQGTGKVIQAGGNLGTPVLKMDPLDENGIYIIELSSYNLDLLTTAVFDIGIFLNLSVDHLQRHGTMERYFTAKMRLFHNSKTHAVLSIDSPYTFNAFNQLKCPKTAVSVYQVCAQGVYIHQNKLWTSLESPPTALLSINELSTLQGDHNLENTVAATAVAKLLQLSDEHIAQGLKAFPGIAHRQQHVGTITIGTITIGTTVVGTTAVRTITTGSAQLESMKTQTRMSVVCVNDSKATSVEAAKSALRCYDDIYWILGGEPKGDDLAELKPYFSKVRHAFVIGQACEIFSIILEEYKVPFTISRLLPTAVFQALDQAIVFGGTLLLSPACTSWDQFKNFEHRGDCFIQNIYKYCQEKGYVCQK